MNLKQKTNKQNKVEIQKQLTESNNFPSMYLVWGAKQSRSEVLAVGLAPDGSLSTDTSSTGPL